MTLRLMNKRGDVFAIKAELRFSVVVLSTGSATIHLFHFAFKKVFSNFFKTRQIDGIHQHHIFSLEYD